MSISEIKLMLQKNGLLTLGFVLSLASAGLAQHHPGASSGQQSPYVEQLSSPVRGLSPQEVEDLANGRGAGYARMAELNGYPGPRHVLDLKQELNLSTEQEAAIQAEFEQMQAEAKQVGQRILEQEQQLGVRFANRSITSTSLQEQTQELADLYGQLRAVHLNAHLQITPLLSSAQIAQYNKLRGYSE